MAISIVDGLPRHGKTAWLINKHIKDWLKDAYENGYKVYSNVFINVENIKFIQKHYKKPADCIGDIENEKDRKNPKKILYYWRNIDTWNFMTRGTIIVDEATRYFNARRWAMLSEDTEIKLQQHGKDRLDIWGTTQHWSRLDVSLRVLCEDFYRVERVFGMSNTTYISKISCHTLEQLEKWEGNRMQLVKNDETGEETMEDVTDYTYFMPWAPWRKQLYDTAQPVGASKPMPLKHIERFCPVPGCKLHKNPKLSHA